MAAGVAFRTDKKTLAFRRLVETHGGAIDPLPAGAFKSSGTDVNAVVVTLEKAA